MVAICSVMLVALGFDPVRRRPGCRWTSVASVVGRQTPLLALVVPLVLVRLVDGRRGLRETWVPVLVCGVAFAVAQFAASDYVSAQLADIGASLAGAGARVAATHARVPATESVRASVLTGTRSEELDEEDPRREVPCVYAPYALIVAILSVEQIPAVRDWPARATQTYDSPFLGVAGPEGKPVGGNVFTWPTVSTGGTLVLLAGVLEHGPTAGDVPDRGGAELTGPGLDAALTPPGS